MSIKTIEFESILQRLQAMCSGKRKRKYPYVRAPTERERFMGVPEWFAVHLISETHKMYISRCGQEFLTVAALKEWRQNLTFEDVDWSVPSF